MVFKILAWRELSTRPEEKYIGDIEIWNHAEKALKEACEKAGHKIKINPGDGAFMDLN